MKIASVIESKGRKKGFFYRVVGGRRAEEYTKHMNAEEVKDKSDPAKKRNASTPPSYTQQH